MLQERKVSETVQQLPLLALSEEMFADLPGFVSLNFCNTQSSNAYIFPIAFFMVMIQTCICLGKKMQRFQKSIQEKVKLPPYPYPLGPLPSASSFCVLPEIVYV